ncbi:MAG: hypothetical protein HC904_17715 [Blastochloris sp.]|nr:hypothetical protein [Blastochloris sp.]
MNITRWLLLVPLLVSLILMTISSFLMLSRTAPIPNDSDTLISWHQKQTKTENTDLLKQHSEKLLNQLLITEETLDSNVAALKSAMDCFLSTSFITFVFCLAAFVYAKNKKSRTIRFIQSTLSG